jgi:hypothetical protein
MTDTDRIEEEWIRSLTDEAERDLVFLWHITSGRFGGRTYASDALSLIVARVSNALIDSGCKVGFGNPDDNGWQADADILNAETPGAEIAARWLVNPKDVELLVFARRRSC